MPANVDLIVERQKHFESERGVWESHWQEIANYMVPRRAEFTTSTTKGAKRRGAIYDSTAIRANIILAAGMHGQLTSPATPWFSLRITDLDLMKKEEVKRWLRSVERTILDVLNGSNFNSSIHEDYLDLGPFGTSCLYEAEDPDDVVFFDCRPLMEIFIGQNAKGKVDTVHRKFTMTARQTLEEFGKNRCGENVTKALEKDKPDYEKEFEFLHAVFPRHSYDPEKMDSTNMPFASVYIEMGKKEIVGIEGGYVELPYFVDRWLKSNKEVYGRGPGNDALPDAKMVNAMAKTILKAAQKMVDPPIMVPDKNFIMPLETTPSALIFRNQFNPQAKLDPLLIRGDIPIGLEMKKERRAMIREAFFVDLFLMLAEKPKMTATEVLERVEEKMIVLGPALGRLMNELLDPIIRRTFRIVVKRQLVEPMPAILRDQEYEVEYVSPLARAQKMWQLQAVNKWVSTIAPFGEAKPEIFDWVNSDGTVNYIAEVLGVVPEVINTAKQVEQIRAARAQAQQGQQMMAELLQLSEAMKKSGLSLKDLAPGGGGGRA